MSSLALPVDVGVDLEHPPEVREERVAQQLVAQAPARLTEEQRWRVGAQVGRPERLALGAGALQGKEGSTEVKRLINLL